MNSCRVCKKECNHNYCSWDCHVDEAKAEGGQEHLPNGLPVKSIKYNFTMLECEHGDHPDYKYPVMIRDPNPSGTDEEMDITMDSVALIYNDGCIAITLSECCYDMWLLSDGRHMGGASWHKGWKLDVPLKKPEV